MYNNFNVLYTNSLFLNIVRALYDLFWHQPFLVHKIKFKILPFLSSSLSYIIENSASFEKCLPQNHMQTNHKIVTERWC